VYCLAVGVERDGVSAERHTGNDWKTRRRAKQMRGEAAIVLMVVVADQCQGHILRQIEQESSAEGLPVGVIIVLAIEEIARIAVMALRRKGQPARDTF